jgi:hypothetical protein
MAALHEGGKPLAEFLGNVAAMIVAGKDANGLCPLRTYQEVLGGLRGRSPPDAILCRGNYYSLFL